MLGECDVDECVAEVEFHISSVEGGVIHRGPYSKPSLRSLTMEK